MRTLFVSIIALSLLAACNTEKNEVPYTAETSSETVYEVNELVASVKGMSCQNCVASVEALISSHPEVEKVNVNLEERTAHITFKKDKVANMQSIAASLEEYGYELVLAAEI